jgi:isoaspartyl peptidase/L-asparaginase-like protein (Ntn-hydrolase superfamily)
MNENSNVVSIHQKAGGNPMQQIRQNAKKTQSQSQKVVSERIKLLESRCEAMDRVLEAKEEEGNEPKGNVGGEEKGSKVFSDGIVDAVTSK